MISTAPVSVLGPEWFRVSPDVREAMLGVPGFVQRHGAWYAHRNLLAASPDPQAALKLAALAPDLETRRLRRDKVTGVALGHGVTLRPTQVTAIEYIRERRGTLLGDDPRLGKTLSALAAHDPASGPLVIVAPLSTRGVWLGWARRLFPGVEIGVFTGQAFDPEVAGKPIVFAHYDIIASWQMIRSLGTVVLDEAHMLTNPKAKRTVAAAMLCSRAARVIAMTGTPIWNLPPNLWSVLSLINPAAWGGFHDFSGRYGAPESTGYGVKYTGLSRGDELKTRLGEVMLRRRWVDALDELPPITRSVVVAEVDDAARRRLDIIAAKLVAERTDKTTTAGNLAAYRKQVTKVKLAEVQRQVTKITGAGEPVVVWAWHKEAAELIARKVADHDGTSFLISGDITPDERERRIAAWRETPTGVLVATMMVAQVGLDFSHARTAIFAEIDYTPAIIGQAEMRTFHPTRGMDLIFVVANHVMDQRIVRALIAKLGAANPLGVGAAVDSIDALRLAIMGPDEVGDLDRLLEDFLAAA